ncbi:MAG: phosphoenolpyruvate--protein phosphotransferase, partial [Akkermansiaceae bacterium]|nr:phosphoenolpyruvate--protein phosphotransferase [Akkermansiaceae bacterium]
MASKSNHEHTFHGTAVSRGIAFGPIHVVARGFAAPDVYPIKEENIPAEQARFDLAIAKTKEQLGQLQDHIEGIAGSDDEGLVFEAHSLVLEDPGLLRKVSKAIEERKQNAEFCFYA